VDLLFRCFHESKKIKSQIVPEMVSAIMDTQYSMVAKVNTSTNKPTVVKPAVNKLRDCPRQTSLSCGSKITPKSKLTNAMT